MATLLVNLPANADTTTVSLSAALGTAGDEAATITVGAETMNVISGVGTQNMIVDRGATPAAHARGAAVTYSASVTGGTGTFSALTVSTGNLGVTLGTITAANDITTLKSSATPTATERLVRSELTLTGAVAGMGTNSSAGVRGLVTLATSATSGFMYGVQGKLVVDNATVNIGSNHASGIYGQLSASAATITSGHVAVIIASGQSLPTSSYIDMIYAESGGNAINSVLKSIVNATYILDLDYESGPGSAAMSLTGTAGATATKGWLKVNVHGAARYLPLTDSVT